MSNLWPAAVRAIAASLVAWIQREQEAVVSYQAEEIRALRELLGGNGFASPMINDAAWL